MLRSKPAILRAIPAGFVLAGFVVTLLAPSNLRAGEVASEKDEFNGPSFFGEAKEAGSLRPIQNVQVKAELGEQQVSTYTSDEGSFKIPGFGKDSIADDVKISCTKQGYRTLDLSRRRLSGAADAPVVVECLMEKTP
jgi:hypothetical protein